MVVCNAGHGFGHRRTEAVLCSARYILAGDKIFFTTLDAAGYVYVAALKLEPEGCGSKKHVRSISCPLRTLRTPAKTIFRPAGSYSTPETVKLLELRAALGAPGGLTSGLHEGRMH